MRATNLPESLLVVVLTCGACGSAKPPVSEVAVPTPTSAASPDTAQAAAPDVASAAAGADVAAVSAATDGAAPNPEPAVSPAGPASRFTIGGASTGTLDERAASAKWPGSGGPLAHFVRKTEAGEVDAIGLDDSESRTKRLVWGVGGKAGMIHFERGAAVLDGHWALTGGDDRPGAQTATFVGTRAADSDSYAGHYTIVGQNRDARSGYKGELVVTRAGERYDLTWTIGRVQSRGIALADGDALFGCWTEGAKACAVAVYAPAPDASGRWSGRVALSDAPAVHVETLVADLTSAPLSLEVSGDAPDAECVAECSKKGLCAFSLMDGGCFARNDQDCARADNCPGHSGCVLGPAFTCLTPAEASKACKASPFPFIRSCAEEGWCSLVDGRCRAASDSDCASAEACIVDGRCTASDTGNCVAASDANCAGSKACEDEQRCVAKDGACWVAATAVERCKDACAQRGECALQDGVCRPPDEAACQSSAACKKHGRCDSSAAGAPCEVSEEGCAAAEVCKTTKACTAIEGHCRAVTQAYCTYLCSLHDGSAQLGLCTAKNGRCINPEDP